MRYVAIACMPCLALAAACGGGEVVSQPPERPLPTPPLRPLALPTAMPPEALAIVDSVPAAGATVAAGAAELTVSHLAPVGLAFSYTGDCRATGVALRRTVTGLSAGGQELIEHHLRCDLAPFASYRLGIAGADGAADGWRAELPFATGTEAGPPALVVQDARTLPRATVNGLFDAYMAQALGEQLEGFGAEVGETVTEQVAAFAERAWGELASPDVSHDVIVQRAAYTSRDPRGQPDAMLTGLIAMPEVGLGRLTPRSRVVLLSHATGSTPSSLESSDSWLMLAAILAGRGHLVIAPDNWGRGGQTSGPETYLLGSRVANNSVDLLRAVLANADYREFLAEPGAVDVSLIGYSQGGHSAVATWLQLTAFDAAVTVRELYSGGAPHNLYQTAIGAMQAFAGVCDGNPWCRDVVEDTIRAYLVGRVVPGFLTHADTGFALDDVVADGAIAPDFARGLLGDDSRFDRVKALLHGNSYTNLVGLHETLPASATHIHLYHSEFDRLVPERNTRELARLLAAGFNVTYHDDECAGLEHRLVAGLVEDIVGVMHTVCGLEMLDDALKGLARLERTAAGGGHG